MACDVSPVAMFLYYCHTYPGPWFKANAVLVNFKLWHNFVLLGPESSLTKQLHPWIQQMILCFQDIFCCRKKSTVGLLIVYESLKVIAWELAAPWRRRRSRLFGVQQAIWVKMWGWVWSGRRPLAGWQGGTSRPGRGRKQRRGRRMMVSQANVSFSCPMGKCQTSKD